MKKKVFGITLLLVIFTFGFAHGEELIDEEILMAEPEVAEEGVEFIEPQDLVEEVEDLEEVEELAEVIGSSRANKLYQALHTKEK